MSSEVYVVATIILVLSWLGAAIVALTRASQVSGARRIDVALREPIARRQRIIERATRCAAVAFAVVLILMPAARLWGVITSPLPSFYPVLWLLWGGLVGAWATLIMRRNVYESSSLR